MITIFNRKELLTTFDLNEQARVRNILTDNSVEYYVKVINRISSSPIASGDRSRTGSFGVNQNNIYEYKIYVHKRNFEEAVYLIQK